MMEAAVHGNLTEDPKGQKAGQADVARFTVAVDDGYRDSSGEWKKRPSLFVNVECWGSTARGVVEQLHKGSRVVVIGRWRADEYEHEGQKRRRQYVVADAIGSAVYKAEQAAPAEPATESEKDEDGGGDPDFWGGAK